MRKIHTGPTASLYCGGGVFTNPDIVQTNKQLKTINNPMHKKTTANKQTLYKPTKNVRKTNNNI